MKHTCVMGFSIEECNPEIEICEDCNDASWEDFHKMGDPYANYDYDYDWDD